MGPGYARRMPELVAGSVAFPRSGPGSVLTIGNFDGVHRGHQALLRRLVTRAHERGALAVVYTFEPSPRAVLAPAQAPPRILDWPTKVRLLFEAGVDRVVVERFSRAFAQHPPEWFARHVLGERLRAQALIVGHDFRFGRARAGDTEALRQALPSLEVEELAAVQVEGRVVSSSAIRAALLQGEVRAASAMLGRDWSLGGTVVAGEARGRQLGFPTANLELDGELLPGHGVYALRVRVDDGPPRPAVANVGMRPTFDGQVPTMEVHLLDGREDLYGRRLDCAFVDRVRGEQRFRDVDELVARIRQDIEAARSLLSSQGAA